MNATKDKKNLLVIFVDVYPAISSSNYLSIFFLMIVIYCIIYHKKFILILHTSYIQYNKRATIITKENLHSI